MEEENSNGLGIKQARFKMHVETKRDSNNVKKNLAPDVLSLRPLQ